jgi:hypothetical protein
MGTKFAPSGEIKKLASDLISSDENGRLHRVPSDRVRLQLHHNFPPVKKTYLDQGCQMAYFKNKNPNLGTILLSQKLATVVAILTKNSAC